MAVFDNHGDNQDDNAVSKMFEFKEQYWKPKIVIHGGDNFDFRAIRKKASEEERRDSMIEDFNKGMNFLNRYRPNFYLRGNHCERLWDLAKENRGVISDFAYKGVREIEEAMDKIHCRMLPWNKRYGILKLGHLKICHGFKGMTGVNAARKAAQTYGSILFGHGHAIQQAAIEGLEQRVGMMCGCLCKLDMDYVRDSLGSLIWEHGFIYGMLNEKTGHFQVWQARRIDGKWLLPTEYITL